MLNPYFLYFLPVLIIFIIMKRFSPSSKTSKQNLPPSPPTFPVLGNLHQLGTHLHRSLRRLARCHGPLMLLRFGSLPMVVVSSADAAAEIMKTHDSIFANRPRGKATQKLLYQQRTISMAPYGEYWRQIRGISVLHLLSTKKVQSFRAIREEETALLVENIRQLGSVPVNLSEMFSSLTNDIICRVSFGKKYDDGEMKRHFREMLEELLRLLGTNCVGDYIPWLSWVDRINGLDAQFESAAKAFDEFLDGVVEEHIEESYNKIKGEDKKDFVDFLLETQAESKRAGGFSLDRYSIKAILLDIFVGGTDTTYTALEWAMTELLRHPKTLKKLQDEATEISNGRPNILESDLNKMPYLKAVIKETLRLHPPIPLVVPRESSQDIKIKGFDVSSKTMVIINAWAIGRDPDLWDEHDKFKPERFLHPTVDFKIGNDNFQLIPFGAGRRGCPGVSFAMAINELALANIVHKFNWALPNGAKGEDLDVTECVGVTIRRKFPLLAVPTLRF